MQFLKDVNITEAEAETLIRLGVSAVDDGLQSALDSFSDSQEVLTLARRVSAQLYPEPVAAGSPQVFTLSLFSPRWREPQVSVHRTKALAERKLIDQYLSDLADTDEELARIQALTGQELIDEAENLGDFVARIEAHTL